MEFHRHVSMSAIRLEVPKYVEVDTSEKQVSPENTRQRMTKTLSSRADCMERAYRCQ